MDTTQHAARHLLLERLHVAVPAWIARVRLLTPAERDHRAAELAEMIAGRKEGFDRLDVTAEGLAIMACLPGGVDLFNHHWCTDHQACTTAESRQRDQDAAPGGAGGP
jgi:hypothetical protein